MCILITLINFHCVKRIRKWHDICSIYVSSETFNPFYATGLSLEPLKTSENERFSNAFGEYRKREVA